MNQHSVSRVAAAPAGLAWLAALFIGLVLALTALQARAQAAAGTPDALVQKVANDVLNAIKNDPQVQSGNVSHLLQLVDEKILPYVDFEKTTRLAASRYWRQATPDQQHALIKEFRTTLVRTYGGAVASVKPKTTIELRPSHYAADATDVVVRTLIRQPGADPISMDYRLEKEAGGWKVYDLNVLGVWLIENYRNQFSQQISKDGIDGLIKSLGDLNRQFDNSGSQPSAR